METPDAVSRSSLNQRRLVLSCLRNCLSDFCGGGYYCVEVNGKTDQELLQEYTANGSDAAFGELARRYVDLVHSAALRLTRSPQLAEDVAQGVFVALAQKAVPLSRHTVLSGWLHTTTRNLAANAVRAESRRQAREQQAALMNESSDSDAAWERIAPHLDSALGQLRAGDRDVVLLRFFERRSMGEIARTLGLSEPAAQKRVARALERLRRALDARGAVVPAVLIASVLAARSVEAAPAGLAALAASASAAGVGATGLGSFLKVLAMTKLQATVAGLLFIAGIATPFVVGLAGPVPPSGGSGTTTGSGGAQVDPARDGTNRLAKSAAGTRYQTNSALGRLELYLRQTDQGRTVWGDLTSDEIQTLSHLVWSLPAADYPEALGLRKGLQRTALQKRFRDYLTLYWTELDPVAAANGFLAAGGDGLDSVLSKWAGKDPAAALAWLQLNPGLKDYNYFLDGIIRQLARTDSRSALALLADMPVSPLKQDALLEVVGQWSARDPASAATYALQQPASSQRDKLIRSVATAWAGKDVDAAFAWSETLPEADKAKAMEVTLRAVAQKDPARAANQLLDLGRDSGLGEALSLWAKADTRQAADWVKQLPEGRCRQRALGGILDYWKNQDPRAAAEFAVGMPTEAEQQQVDCVLFSWAGKDFKAAADWANALPAGATRDVALEKAALTAVGSKPEEVASYIARLEPGELQTRLAAEVAEGWCIRDALAACQWVASFPEGNARQRAVAALARFFGDTPLNVDWCQRWLKESAQFSAAEKQKLLSK